MQHMCDHVIHTHAYNASHHQRSQKRLVLFDVPCKTDIADAAAGCAGRYGTAEPKSLRVPYEHGSARSPDLNQTATGEHCVFLCLERPKTNTGLEQI